MKMNLVAFFSTTIIFALLATGLLNICGNSLDESWLEGSSLTDSLSFLSMLKVGALISLMCIFFSELFSLPVRSTSGGYSIFCAVLSGGCAYALSCLLARAGADPSFWFIPASTGLGLISGWGGAFTARLCANK